ncbi:hypothetical protein BaRGS_00025617, partial [Batillaria attramentaria]
GHDQREHQISSFKLNVQKSPPANARHAALIVPPVRMLECCAQVLRLVSFCRSAEAELFPE